MDNWVAGIIGQWSLGRSRWGSIGTIGTKCILTIGNIPLTFFLPFEQPLPASAHHLSALHYCFHHLRTILPDLAVIPLLFSTLLRFFLTRFELASTATTYPPQPTVGDDRYVSANLALDSELLYDASTRWDCRATLEGQVSFTGGLTEAEGPATFIHPCTSSILYPWHSL